MAYDETTVLLLRDVLLMTLKIAAPILAAGVVIGLIISIFQAVTQIQDQTLTFVPKIVVMLGVTILLLPWIVARLIDYSAELFLMIAGGT